MRKIKRSLPVCFAILFLLFAIMASAGELTDNIKKGIARLEMNRLEEAKMYFEREISANPKNGLAYYYAGEVYYRKGEFSKALENYSKAVEMEPENVVYRIGSGIVNLSMGKTEKAIEELQQVIKASPSSFEAVKAHQMLEKIKDNSRSKEIIEKWRELEQKKQVEETVEKKEETPAVAPEERAPRISVDALVKDLRFGTETKRKEASRMLYSFLPEQLAPFLSQFTLHFEKEKNEEVKKNLLLVIGKTMTKEAVDFLFEILESSQQTFDMKMVALQGLSETLSPDAAERLKNVLDKMVSSKLKMRQDATKRIEELEKRIDDLESQKYVLKNDITKLRVERQSIYEKLNMQPESEAAIPGMPGVPAPEVAPGEGPVQILSLEQVKQLREQLRKIENDIQSKESRIARLDKQIENIKSEKVKYEQLLVKRYSQTVKVLGVTRRTAVSTREELPPEMATTFTMPSFGAVAAGAEEEQEQSLALSIIKILGRIGKPEHLSVIEKAWEEYQTESFELDYGLVRAQLGSYEYIERLVNRLQEDYPPSDPEEVYFRADIARVLGKYLAEHPNQEYVDLLGYIAESDPNQVVRVAANQALSKIKTKEASKQT